MLLFNVEKAFDGATTTPEQRAAKFVEQGKERIRAVVQRELDKWEAEHRELILAEQFDAFGKILQGYEAFAACKHFPFTDEEDGVLIPTSHIIPFNWSKLRDYSTSRVETRYLEYLYYRDCILNLGKDITSNSNIEAEALLDTLEEEDGRAWDMAGTLRLQELPDDALEEIAAKEIYEMEDGEEGADELCKVYKGTKILYKPEYYKSIFRRGCASKYERAVVLSFHSGCSYDEMMSIKPEDFSYIPLESAENVALPDNREKIVLLTIGMGYKLNTYQRALKYQSLRTYAEQMGIPYSKMLEAYTLIRKASRDSGKGITIKKYL